MRNHWYLPGWSAYELYYDYKRADVVKRIRFRVLLADSLPVIFVSQFARAFHGEFVLPTH